MKGKEISFTGYMWDADNWKFTEYMWDADANKTTIFLIQVI